MLLAKTTTVWEKLGKHILLEYTLRKENFENQILMGYNDGTSLVKILWIFTIKRGRCNRERLRHISIS